MTSRGSVIPLFLNQIKNKKKITITHKDMTRFLLNLDSAIELVKYSMKSNISGCTFVKKAPSAFVTDIANSLYEILGIKKNNFNFIGIRPGEKINETLISYEESRLTKNFKNFFILYNNLMNEKYMNFFEKGTKSKLFNYSSEMKNNLISGKKLINLISKTINQNIDET